MGSILRKLFLAAAVAGLMCNAGAVATAGQILRADFSGQISPGNANVQAPFDSALVQGGAVGGFFAFDADQVPAAGSGFYNVAIPDGTAFNFNLGGGLEFTLADAKYPAFVQYNDGQFNGFSYQSDFTFAGNQYELNFQGGIFSVSPLVGGVPTFQSLVNGYVNNGNGNLTNIVPFEAAAVATPEPGTIALAASGLPVGLILLLRRRRNTRAA